MAYSGRMPDGPLNRFANITKHDDTEYDPPIMLLRCEEAGDVTVVDIRGTTVLITALAGEYIPGPILKLKSTGTTGTLFTGWRNEG